MNEHGTGFNLQGIGKPQGKTRKRYSPFEAWEVSCVT